MRTNIVLDDDLLQEAMRLSGQSSKRGTVEEALRVYVQVKTAEQGRGVYLDHLRRLEPRLKDLKVSESPSALLRQDRERE